MLNTLQEIVFLVLHGHFFSHMPRHQIFFLNLFSPIFYTRLFDSYMQLISNFVFTCLTLYLHIGHLTRGWRNSLGGMKQLFRKCALFLLQVGKVLIISVGSKCSFSCMVLCKIINYKRHSVLSDMVEFISFLKLTVKLCI